MECLPELLTEVFLALLKNASDGSKKKEKITVRTRHSRGRVIVDVVHAASVIGTEVLEKFFAPSLADTGASLTATLQPGSGGKITFRTRPRKAAVFRLELPARP